MAPSGVLSNDMFYLGDTLPSISPILIIIYHLVLTLESYKLIIYNSIYFGQLVHSHNYRLILSNTGLYSCEIYQLVLLFLIWWSLTSNPLL